MAHRKVKTMRTLNDQIEEIHLKLYETNPKYKDLLEAVWDSDAVEGSLSIDNTLAAQMLRQQAIDDHNADVSRRKLDTIVKCMGVVLRRYEFDRKTRRQTVHGERVPNGDGE
jgi:hypothetical protein